MHISNKQKRFKMKYQLSSIPTKETLTLQSVGHVIGSPAIEIKKGDSLMWNFGAVEKVTDVVDSSKFFVTVSIQCKSGYTGTRKIKKTRLVCILKP